MLPSPLTIISYILTLLLHYRIYASSTSILATICDPNSITHSKANSRYPIVIRNIFLIMIFMSVLWNNYLSHHQIMWYTTLNVSLRGKKMWGWNWWFLNLNEGFNGIWKDTFTTICIYDYINSFLLFRSLSYYTSYCTYSIWSNNLSHYYLPLSIMIVPSTGAPSFKPTPVPTGKPSTATPTGQPTSNPTSPSGI